MPPSLKAATERRTISTFSCDITVEYPATGVTRLAVVLALPLLLVLRLDGGRPGDRIAQRHGHVDAVERDRAGRALEVVKRGRGGQLQRVAPTRRRPSRDDLQVTRDAVRLPVECHRDRRGHVAQDGGVARIDELGVDPGLLRE